MKIAPFRGYGKHDKRWFYGYLNNRGGEMVIMDFSTEWFQTPIVHGKNTYTTDVVLSHSVGEFTGVFDTNHQPIYVGDILEGGAKVKRLTQEEAETLEEAVLPVGFYRHAEDDGTWEVLCFGQPYAISGNAFNPD